MYKDYLEIMGDALDELATWEAEWADFEEDMKTNPWGY